MHLCIVQIVCLFQLYCKLAALSKLSQISGYAQHLSLPIFGHQVLSFLDALASLEEPFLPHSLTHSMTNSLIHGFSNHLICPLFSTQQSLHLIKHHSLIHLLIPNPHSSIHSKIRLLAPKVLLV